MPREPERMSTAGRMPGLQVMTGNDQARSGRWNE
jgi:hypothetical protein